MSGQYIPGITVDDEGWDSQARPIPGRSGSPFSYAPEPEQPQPHLASETLGYHDPEVAYRRHTPYGQPYLGEDADMFKPISTGDINSAGPAWQKSKAAQATKLPYPPHPFYSEKELEEARSKPGLMAKLFGPLAGLMHPHAVGPMLDDLDKTGWGESFVNSVKSFYPPALPVDIANAMRAVPAPGNPAGSLAPQDMDAALMMGNFASGALGGKSLAKDAGLRDGRGAVGAFLSPDQIFRAQREGGHIKDGSWGSLEALKEAQALGAKLPPIGSQERAPFVNEAYKKTGWDVGAPEQLGVDHLLTEVDSSGARLNPAYATPRSAMIINDERVPIADHAKVPLGDLMSGIGEGTLIGDAVPSLRSRLVERFTMRPDMKIEHQAGSYNPRTKNIDYVRGQSPDSMEMLLRHEGLGHAVQQGYQGSGGQPFFNLQQLSEVPRFKSRAERFHEEAAKIQSDKTGGDPWDRIVAQQRNHADRAAKYSQYVTRPWEKLARLTEDPNGQSREIAPSQRDAFSGKMLSTDPRVEKLHGYPFSWYDLPE